MSQREDKMTTWRSTILLLVLILFRGSKEDLAPIPSIGFKAVCA